MKLTKQDHILIINDCFTTTNLFNGDRRLKGSELVQKIKQKLNIKYNVINSEDTTPTIKNVFIHNYFKEVTI